MRAVVQRVNSASVTVEGKKISDINKGLLVFLGVKNTDTDKDLEYICDKIANLRIFDDSDGKMNLSVIDIKGEILAVPQFTLYGDARKGRRPGFSGAAEPEKANKLFEMFVEKLCLMGIPVKAGRFRSSMKVKLENDGPVTIILDSEGVF